MIFAITPGADLIAFMAFALVAVTFVVDAVAVVKRKELADRPVLRILTCVAAVILTVISLGLLLLPLIADA